METSEDMGQEDTDMAEADINKAEKAVAGADKERTGEEHTAEKEIKVMDQMPVAEDQETYRSLVKKVGSKTGRRGDTAALLNLSSRGSQRKK